MEVANNIEASCSASKYLLTRKGEIEATTVQTAVYSVADKMQ